MFLSARLLNNVANVNSYDVGLQTAFTEGDQLPIYIQLIDLNKDSDAKPLTGRRYVPVTGSTLIVTLKSVDSAKTLTKIAVNPFPGDTSVWSFDILAADMLKGTWTLNLALTEAGNITRGRVDAALLSQPIIGAFV